MADSTVTLSDWTKTLTTYGGDSASYVAKNPKLAAATFDILKGIAEKQYCDAGADAIGLGGEISGKLKMSTNSKNAIKSTSFVVSEAKLTMSLRVLMGAAEGGKAFTPAGAVMLVGATVMTKTGQAIGLAGDDQEKAKCVGALMEVAGNVGVTAVTWETGVGALLGLASIAASSYSAYRECRDVSF